MNEKNIWHKIRIALMSITVMVFMIIGFLIFIRPTERENLLYFQAQLPILYLMEAFLRTLWPGMRTPIL